MTIRTPATRQRMAKCFKEAAQYLWSGNGPYSTTPGYRYICSTFDRTSASAATRRACERLINKRLGSCASVEEWLKVNRCIPRNFDESDPVGGNLWPEVQAFRKAWLLNLAEEFSQPLKVNHVL